MLMVFTHAGYAGQVHVPSLKGTVTARSASAPDRSLKQGDEVTEGTRVRTGQGSSAVLRFDDGRVVALKAPSTEVVSVGQTVFSAGANILTVCAQRGRIAAFPLPYTGRTHAAHQRQGRPPHPSRQDL